MLLTKQQVKEKLGIGDARLEALVQAGTLKPANERKAGAKKFFAKFRAAEVAAVAREMRENGKAPRRAPVAPIGPAGVLTQLAELNAKVDRLLKIWS